MAKFDNPFRINLSFVWTAYSCLNKYLKSDQTSLTFSSVFQSMIDDSHSLAGFRRELAKWISLGIRPSICFDEIFQSSDEIRCGNGVLAFGTEEFRNLVLLDPEVEICGPIASSWCGGDGSLGSGVAGAIVVSIKIDIAIIVGVIVVVIFWGPVDIVTSSSGHFFCCAKL
jgi:hypothetical protein